MRTFFDFSLSSGFRPLEPRLSPSSLVDGYGDPASFSDPTVPEPPDDPPDDPMPPPEPSPGPFPGPNPPIIFPDPPIGGPIGPR